MADNRNFDRLVSNLPLEERQSLLKKLTGHSTISKEPLYFEDGDTVSARDLKGEYSDLPWFYRLWFHILSFFKAKAPSDIFGDHQVSTLGDKITERSPGLYNYQQKLLLPAFYRQLEKLKEATRFFYSALDISVNRDKGAFFAFLGSLEMPDVHKQLQVETEPGYIAENNPDTAEKELRQIAFRTMDDALSLITEDQRNNMYSDARSLNCLRALSTFLYDRLIMSFSEDSAMNGLTCSANVVKDLLVSLDNALVSLKVIPPMTLLESLFVFLLNERAEEAGFDISREISRLLIKAEESLTIIRDFNKQVPLTWIIRCSSRNMSYVPKETSGGEDWYVIFRDYWRRRIEILFADYMKDRRRRELLSAFRFFFKGRELKKLENIASDSNPDGLPIRGGTALSFLHTFYLYVFMPEVNKILRPVMIDGQFQKKENRAEFAESYNNLIKVEDDIVKLDQKISPEGEYGKRYEQARQEMTALQVKRRKMQIVLEEAQEEGGIILEQARQASLNMVDILNGFRGRDSTDRYGLLTNLSDLAGQTSQFVKGLDETIQVFQKLSKLLEDMDFMED